MSGVVAFALVELDSAETLLSVAPGAIAGGVNLLVYCGAYSTVEEHCPKVLEICERLPVVKAVCGLPGVLPQGCVPVAVVPYLNPDARKTDKSLVGAEPLYAYVHPVNAFYVFSAIGNELPESLCQWCRDTVYVPVKGVRLSLSGALNTLLYDRRTKEIFHGREK